MRVLHYYPEDTQGIITSYVALLCEKMGIDVENEKTMQPAEAISLLHSHHYDILHLHGCWHNSMNRIVNLALNHHIRLVVSPHGQLEPWVLEEKYWGEKLPKQLLYQKRIISQAYAVVIQGKMEEECMRKLRWNSRTVIVRNCLITYSITQEEMARQMSKVYRRVMDSNTIELMTDDTKTTLRQLIKVGITGDVLWLNEQSLSIEDKSQWRMLLCYASQEQIYDIVMRGIELLHHPYPDLDVKQISCFMPDNYQPSKSVESVIGMQFATENERLMSTFRHLRKLTSHHQLTLAHLVELNRELRMHHCDESRLNEELKNHHLYQFAARIMQLMSDLTGLDEGFMPMLPVNDRLTRQMKKQINNHLKI